MISNNYQKTLDNTGDITSWELINKCTSVSSDFSELKEGEPRILWMDEHVGTYIGKTVDGLYNVIECTVAFGGGILYSWVDADGTRRDQKGGEARGTWLEHGMPTKWVSY